MYNFGCITKCYQLAVLIIFKDCSILVCEMEGFVLFLCWFRQFIVAHLIRMKVSLADIQKARPRRDPGPHIGAS